MSEQAVFGARRSYNRWVANQTLEDYALRFTAKSARRWSIARVSNTALGAISFLALEAIGGTITLHYGFDNASAAILVVAILIFLTGLPISYYAARYGVDIDLLSRGAGFGYIGSTITSLIYASFTFIFFALEAAIMSSALNVLFGLPLSIGYLISSLVIIPLATHGITFISRFQLWSQPLWIILQLTPFVFILYHEWQSVDQWMQYAPEKTGGIHGTSLVFFGAASSVLFSLMVQIGEQVDFLRFLPVQEKHNRLQWWLALISSGPGWILLGAVKILAGSFLAVLAINHGIAAAQASDPTYMYLVAFGYLNQSPMATLALAGIFVIVCQLKINVTNAYAGSIAWSNFFSRLTHSHPGRVVWLVFNVMIALLLMELGIYQSLENILGIYSNIAVSWVGVLVADLVINKPLGYSPKHIEFKRANLYDINPVGFGAMLIASCIGICAYIGLLGETAQALSPYLALTTAFVTSPLIAIATRGKYYLARKPVFIRSEHVATCTICQNTFETEDMATCPAYGGHICSLCCSIDSRCHDQCKEGARFSDQLIGFLSWLLPRGVAARLDPRLVQFTTLLLLISAILSALFWLVYRQVAINHPDIHDIISSTLIHVFILLLIVVGVLIWLFVLANESRQLALDESQRQTRLLSEEILAHEETDRALQKAKEAADAANQAKSRYLTGISHELRSPLNSILGYAQLLEKDTTLVNEQKRKIQLIRRGGEHLADLIEGLLDISRIEARRMEVRRDHVRMPDLVNELVEMFRLQAENKGLIFEHIAKTRLPAIVIADEKHVRQILINLLSNAVKYTTEGKITFATRYRNQVAEFTIHDTGIGIEQDDIERVFQPFERIRKPGSPQSPGTGLGLTISKFLTDIMGGELSVNSTPGKGSTFKLSLMLPAVNRATNRTQQIKHIESYIGDTRTVMVVDDDASHRGLISEILTPLGFVVLECQDAAECLATLEKTRIDLFLLDISMPGMSGWDLVKTLRIMNLTQPVIMVSANAFENAGGERQAASTARLHDDYLVKPIRDSLLLEKIARALNIQWRYEQDIHHHDPKQQASAAGGIEQLFDTISPEDSRELRAMAELGYVEGLENILKRLESAQAPQELLTVIRRYMSRYQFAKIIELTNRAMA